MKGRPLDNVRRHNRAWLLGIAVLAPALALGTWLLFNVVTSARLPENLPKLPDVKPMSTALRDLLVAADKEARSQPGSAEIVGKLGKAYHSNQFFEQAASAYKIAARLAPDDYQWVYCQASLAEESGQEKEQLELLRETLRLKPDHVPALMKLADGYFKQDKLDEAARYYQMAAAADKDASPQPGFGLGRVGRRLDARRRTGRMEYPLRKQVKVVPPVGRIVRVRVHVQTSLEPVNSAGPGGNRRVRRITNTLAGGMKATMAPPALPALLSRALVGRLCQ